MLDSSMAVAGSIPHRTTGGAAAQTKSASHSKQSGFCTKAVHLAEALIKGGCVAALAGLVAVNPTITGALSSVFSKVPAALSEAGFFIASNAAQFAMGSAIGGAINVTDGIFSMVRGSTQSDALSKTNNTLRDSAQDSVAFNKLKSLYRSTQRRGALQAAIGAAAIVVGGLALAGIVSNPIGLGVAAAVTAAVMLGVQIHKLHVNRQATAAREEYKVWVEEHRCDAETAAATVSPGEISNAGDTESVSNPVATDIAASAVQGDSAGSSRGFGSTI